MIDSRYVLGFALLGACVVADDEATDGDTPIAALPAEELYVLNHADLLTQGLPHANFAALPPAARHQTVRLAQWDSPVRDQADEPWCTAFAAIGAMEQLAKRHFDAALDLSEADLFASYKQFNILPALEAAKQHGVAPEVAWPFKRSAKPSLAQQRHTQIGDYVAPQTIDEVLEELAQGFPLVIGIDIDISFNYVKGDGRIPLPKAPPPLTNGHAMTVSGFVRDSDYEGGGYLVVKNSLGTTWGQAGYGKLPLAYCQHVRCVFVSIRSIRHNDTSTPKRDAPPRLMPSLASVTATVSAQTVYTTKLDDPEHPGSFRLRIDGTPAALAQIESVLYNVHTTFGAKQFASGKSAADNFTSNKYYTTRYSNWRTLGTELRLRDGRKVTIPGTVIRLAAPLGT